LGGGGVGLFVFSLLCEDFFWGKKDC